LSTAVRPLDKAALDRSSGNFALVDTLRKWGVTFFSGVNGGGLIHVTKHLEPYLGLKHSGDRVPRMQTMGEYVAGFVPLGYYLASGRIAGCLTTTGAATKLGSSGITDAKLHNIPAVYVIALNSTLSIGRSPLQDVSEHGMNIVPQLRAELGDACIVLDDIDKMGEQLELAESILAQSKPVAIAFHPDVLSKNVDLDVPARERPRMLDQVDADRFVNEFPEVSRGRRVIIYAGAEASRCPGITALTTQLSELLQAPTVWSVNGANAISPDNRYGYGYISFGGNDEAMKLWRSMTADDIVITLGFDSGEYSLNLSTIPAGHVWHFTAWNAPYGHKDGDFRHRVDGDYRVVRGDIERTLEYVLPLMKGKVKDRPAVRIPTDLNTRTISREVRDGCVDAMEFYAELHRSWRPHSIGFDDVCTAYKDRQYVAQRPHPSIPFHTVHDGSAMGGAFGLGVGARAADSSLHTFVFSGDGCWRLYGGALAEASNLGMNLFIINNERYAIVDKGLEVVIPDWEKERYHGVLQNIDFVAAAKAHGWDGYRLRADLGNLDDILNACYAASGKGRSVLVDVPIDADQVLGLNPRLYNLTTDTYL
jgi:acetolactate synthase I/II/III large subunit